MAISQETLKKRAVKTAVRKSKKLGHLVTQEELLSSKIQILRVQTRILLGIGGSLFILACIFAWPLASTTARTVEGIVGILMILSGIIGISRTLDKTLDTFDTIGFCGDVISSAGEIVGDIFSL